MSGRLLRAHLTVLSVVASGVASGCAAGEAPPRVATSPAPARAEAAPKTEAGNSPAPAPCSTPEKAPAPALGCPVDRSAKPVETTPHTLEEALARARELGFVEAATVIETRVAQTKPKMKLEPDEGLHVARFVIEDFPALPDTVTLSRRMPKTAVELVRSVHERGVPASEAEAMARYMARLLDSLKPGRPEALDENSSHVIGREWHDIDYSGENLSWERQQKIYEPKGIPNFKEAATLERFFRVESAAPYFARVYVPAGSVP
jgi:hypothetical protein